MTKNFPYLRATVIFIVALAIFRLWYCTQFELVGDEAYYWLWSKHLDWSYFSKGPGVAWTIFLGTKILGDTVLGIRWISVLLSAATGWLIFKLTRSLFDEKTAFYTVITATLIPLFMIGGLLMTIDPLSVFFWALAAWLFWKNKDNPSPFAWTTTGLAIGIGMLCKYTNIAELISFAIFCLWIPQYRKKWKPFLIMTIVSILCLIPVLIWNEQHNWITFHHLIHRGSLDKHWQFSPQELRDFLLSQILVFNPLFFIGLLIGLTALLFQKPPTLWEKIKIKLSSILNFLRAKEKNKFHSNFERISQSEHKNCAERHPAWRGGDGTQFRISNFNSYCYLFCLFFPLLIFYTILSLNKAGQANWAAPSWFAGTILLVALWKNLTLPDKKFHTLAKITAQFTIAISIVIFIALHTLPFIYLPDIFTKMKSDPLKRIRGAQNIAQQVARIQKDYNADFIIAGNYGQASLLAFYMPHQPQTFVPIHQGFQNQFSFWPNYTKNFTGKSAIYLTDSPEILESLQNEFTTIEPILETHSFYHGKPVDKFHLFYCRELKN